MFKKLFFSPLSTQSSLTGQLTHDWATTAQFQLCRVSSFLSLLYEQLEIVVSVGQVVKFKISFQMILNPNFC